MHKEKRTVYVNDWEREIIFFPFCFRFYSFFPFSCHKEDPSVTKTLFQPTVHF